MFSKISNDIRSSGIGPKTSQRPELGGHEIRQTNTTAMRGSSSIFDGLKSDLSKIGTATQTKFFPTQEQKLENANARMNDQLGALATKLTADRVSTGGLMCITSILRNAERIAANSNPPIPKNSALAIAIRSLPVETRMALAEIPESKWENLTDAMAKKGKEVSLAQDNFNGALDGMFGKSEPVPDETTLEKADKLAGNVRLVMDMLNSGIDR